MCDQQGISIIEILLVIALVALVTSFGMTMNFDQLRGNGFRTERDALISSLQKARSQAMSSMCVGEDCAKGKSHGVFIYSDMNTGLIHHYVIFQGYTYSGRDVEMDEVITTQYGIHFSGLSEIVFTNLSGDPTDISIGSITVSDPNGTHQGQFGSTISINEEGRVSWTN